MHVHKVNGCVHEVDVVIASDWAATAAAALALALSPPFFRSSTSLATLQLSCSCSFSSSQAEYWLVGVLGNDNGLICPFCYAGSSSPSPSTTSTSWPAHNSQLPHTTLLLMFFQTFTSTRCSTLHEAKWKDAKKSRSQPSIKDAILSQNGSFSSQQCAKEIPSSGSFSVDLLSCWYFIPSLLGTSIKLLLLIRINPHLIL